MNIKQIKKTKITLPVSILIGTILISTYFIFFLKPDNSKKPKPVASTQREVNLPDSRPEEIVGEKITLRRKYFHLKLQPLSIFLKIQLIFGQKIS